MVGSASGLLLSRALCVAGYPVGSLLDGYLVGLLLDRTSGGLAQPFWLESASLLD